MNKVLIFSAPSGSGKTTIVHHLLKIFPQLEFSISATNRAPRGEEKNGVDYYFLSTEEFQKKIAQNEFLEWENVYAEKYYGTPKSEVERIWKKNHVMVCDIDVKGGVNIKKIVGEQALAIFIQPPSVEVLRERLTTRSTDSPEAIECRVQKAQEELSYASQFDVIIMNDNLENALREAEQIVREFIN